MPRWGGHSPGSELSPDLHKGRTRSPLSSSLGHLRVLSLLQTKRCHGSCRLQLLRGAGLCGNVHPAPDMG